MRVYNMAGDRVYQSQLVMLPKEPRSFREPMKTEDQGTRVTELVCCGMVEQQRENLFATDVTLS